MFGVGAFQSRDAQARGFYEHSSGRKTDRRRRILAGDPVLNPAGRYSWAGAADGCSGFARLTLAPSFRPKVIFIVTVSVATFGIIGGLLVAVTKTMTNSHQPICMWTLSSVRFHDGAFVPCMEKERQTHEH